MALRGRMSMLVQAIRANDCLAFKSILETDGLPSSPLDFKLLKKSLLYGRIKIVKLLLDEGCCPDLDGYPRNSPLHLAIAKKNCYQLVKLLLAHGARVDRVNVNGDSTLHAAFEEAADGKVIDAMLQAHVAESLANVANKVGLTYLHIAATRAKVGCIKNLIEHGKADVDCQVDRSADSPYAGYTPLHMAVECGRMKAAEILLGYGANLWAKDRNGTTPIHLALERRDVEMIELLFAYDLQRDNHVNRFGLTHFMAACACSGPAVAQDFLNNLANNKSSLNISKKVRGCSSYAFKGYTAMHFAAEYGRADVVQLLLANGADTQARTCQGLTPEHLAMKNEHEEVASLIKLQEIQYEPLMQVGESEYAYDFDFRFD